MMIKTSFPVYDVHGEGKQPYDTNGVLLNFNNQNLPKQTTWIRLWSIFTKCPPNRTLSYRKRLR